MSIITGGLGTKCLITQGYGKCKWCKEPHHTHYIELCPYCHNNLKNHVYASPNGFSGKIFRCEHCYGLLKLGEGDRWVAVEKEWASDW